MKASKYSSVAAAFCLAVGLLVLPFAPLNAQPPEELTLEGVIERHREAAGRIRTYDIRIRATRQFLMKSEIELRDERGRPIKVRWVPLAPGEEGKRDEDLYREVYADGKFRVESLDAKSGDTEGVKIVGDETETRYDIKSGASLVSPRQPPFLGEGLDHRDYYENVCMGVAMAYLLKLRDEVKVAHDRDNPELILVDTPPGKIISNHHIRVWLDESCGNLLKKVETWRDGVLRRDLKVTARREVEPGIWVPVAGESTSYTHLPEVGMKSLPTSILKYEVDLEHSHWNTPIDGDLFLAP